MTAAETKIELKLDGLQKTISELCSRMAVATAQNKTVCDLVQKHETILNGNGGIGLKSAFALLETSVNQNRVFSTKKCVFWGAASIGLFGTVVAAMINILPIVFK